MYNKCEGSNLVGCNYDISQQMIKNCIGIRTKSKIENGGANMANEKLKDDTFSSFLIRYFEFRNFYNGFVISEPKYLV